MYLDAAHGGWLGWPNNLQAASQISFHSLLIIFFILFLLFDSY